MPLKELNQFVSCIVELRASVHDWGSPQRRVHLLFWNVSKLGNKHKARVFEMISLKNKIENSFLSYSCTCLLITIATCFINSSFVFVIKQAMLRSFTY